MPHELAARALFARLIDYAGLFPPARLEMGLAAAEYTSARDGSDAWMLGRFVVPLARVAEFLEALPARPPGGPFALSVIVDGGSDARGWFDALRLRLCELERLRADPRIRIEAVEIPLPTPIALRDTHEAAIGQCGALLRQSALGEVPAAVEFPRGPQWEARLVSGMRALARAGLEGKLRCGGADAASFPPIAEIAGFVRAAADAAVPFKATAGLHHPIRGRSDERGGIMHGFLNLAAAVLVAEAGADERAIAEMLACEDATGFALDANGFRAGGRWFDAAAVARMREHGFRGFGSCSFTELIADVLALGILARGAHA